MSVLPNVRVAPIKDVLIRFIEDEAILLHLGTEQYLGLNSVGTRMWILLHDTNSVEACYQRLCEEYDVEPDLLRRDLVEFVEELLGQSLISLEPTPE
jgi:hypothetical protein